MGVLVADVRIVEEGDSHAGSAVAISLRLSIFPA